MNKRTSIYTSDSCFFQSKGLRPEALANVGDKGMHLSPLFVALGAMQSNVFLPLLLANFTSPLTSSSSSSAPVRSLLDQEFKLPEENGEGEVQLSLREMAKRMGEEGEMSEEDVDYFKALFTKLEDAERGK